MIDRSAEVIRKFQAELNANADHSRVRVVTSIDGNEEFYTVYLHKEGEDRFNEFHVRTSVDQDIDIPPYQEWWK